MKKTIKKTIKETVLFVFAIAVMGKIIAPFIMLSQCSIVMRPEIYDLISYVR